MSFKSMPEGEIKGEKPKTIIQKGEAVIKQRAKEIEEQGK